MVFFYKSKNNPIRLFIYLFFIYMLRKLIRWVLVTLISKVFFHQISMSSKFQIPPVRTL